MERKSTPTKERKKNRMGRIAEENDDDEKGTSKPTHKRRTTRDGKTTIRRSSTWRERLAAAQVKWSPITGARISSWKKNISNRERKNEEPNWQEQKQREKGEVEREKGIKEDMEIM